MSRDLDRLGPELAAVLDVRRDELVEAACADLRFPVADMRREAERAVAALRTLGSVAPSVEGRGPLCGPGESVALLLPYNLGAIALQFIATLSALGNAVTVRFSSRAPTLARLSREIVDAMPLSTRVTIDERPAREFLAVALSDPAFPLLIAYGGDRLGAELLAVRAGTNIVFEGPGKDPLVVGRDADAAAVAQLVRGSKFSRSGQECVATERLVMVGEQPEVLEALVDMTAGLSASREWDRDADVTPLASSTIAPMIARQLEEAVARGARVLTGGGVHGDFVEPTVISDVPVDCALWQDETFGPVLPVRVARDEDAAVADALGGRYGLHGIVTGGGAQELASRMVGEPLAVPVSELRYGAIGTVTIDRRQFADPEDEHRPFGGWGVSGWVRHADGTLSQGPRLLAREATREA